jgi:mRNA-degrading endonuclease RelE of RelBE toxin-antitoxin system
MEKHTTRYEMVIDPELKRQSDEISKEYLKLLKDDLKFVEESYWTLQQVRKMQGMWNQSAEETIDLDESEYEILDV